VAGDDPLSLQAASNSNPRINSAPFAIVSALMLRRNLAVPEDRRARRLTLLGTVDRQSLPAAETETAPSVLWFAAIQGIKRKQDLAHLAPKSLFILAEAVERVVRQAGETQKATHELSGRDGGFDRFRHRAGHVFHFVRDAVRGRIAAETALVSPPEHELGGRA